LRTEGSGLGSPKEPPVLGVEGSVAVKVKGGKDEVVGVEKKVMPPGGGVKFIVGCTESEDEEFNEEIYGRANKLEPLNEEKSGVFRRCPDASVSCERNRLRSECSSGVSTRFSSSESSKSSNCSIVSGLSCEDDVSNLDSSGIDSLPDVEELETKKKKMASMDAATLTLATNEGLVVCIPPPLTKSLIVNPAPSVEIVWSYDVIGGMLVANAPTSIQRARGVNDALVTLLEYGENELHCSRAVILVERDSLEKESLLRMFSFLGFIQLEARETPSCLRPYTKDYVLMVTDFTDLQENESDSD